MTAKVSNGVASQMPVNAATNQLTYAYYDANGNMTSGAGTNMAYDAANRIATAGGETFQYDPNNKMILRSPYNALPEFTFYGGQGENWVFSGCTRPMATTRIFSSIHLGLQFHSEGGSWWIGAWCCCRTGWGRTG